MKRFITAVAFGLMAIAAQAEATFDQIEGLIQQRQYAAAASGLEVIIQNHPKSAKAFYAMAQAQAGLGNLEKAQKALNIATGLNPTLDFAPSSSVQSLKDAITPQTSKIEAVSESHFWRNFAYFALFAGFGVLCYFMWSIYARRIEEEAARDAEREAEYDRAEAKVKQMQAEREAEEAAQAAKEIAEYNAKQEALKAHKNYGKPGFDSANPDKLKTKKQLKEEADAAARIEAEAEARRQRLRAEAAEDDARRARSYQSSQPTTVVNNSSNDMLTGIMVGSMLSDHGHHSHDTTVIRETVREVPAPTPSRSSSWDDTPSTPSRSSSWDSDSSSSSSWSSSSSDSSSSWSSSSDSSSSSSSSSWD